MMLKALFLHASQAPQILPLSRFLEPLRVFPACPQNWGCLAAFYVSTQ